MNALYFCIALSIVLSVPLGMALPADSPKAVLPEIRFDFGTVKQGTPVEHEFVLKNEGSAPLRITGLRKTAFLLLSRLPAEIMPGGEVKIRVQLNNPKLSGSLKGEVLIDLNDPVLPIARLVFEGRVKPPIEYSPYPAFFVVGQRGKAREAAIEIINHEPDALRIESIEHPRDRFTTRLETLEEGRRYRLSLILNPDGPGGRNAESITIKTSSPTSPMLKVAANTYLRERVYTFPDNVDLGVVRLVDIKAHPDTLQQITQILMVYQAGGSDFQVKLRTDLSMLDLKSQRGPKGDRFQNTVTLIGEKLQVGPIEGSIIIETNDTEFQTLTVPVRGEIR